jgi:hypothetical protein
MRRAAALAAACWLLLCLAAAAPAVAQELKAPESLDEPPKLFERTGREVGRIAARVPEIREEVARHPGAKREVYTKGGGRWQVSWFTRARRGTPRREIAQVAVDDRSGAVLEAWTGFRVAWTMARGYDGAFGRKVNAPYVWIPLLVAFVLPFLDPRRPLRWLHADVLVLAGFSVSLAYFNAAEVETSVPLVYPLLAYLFVRMLALGLRRRRDVPAPMPRLLVPLSWLALGIVFLAGVRIGLNLMSSNVIDVGYAGVIGADKLADGAPLYGDFPDDNEHGDTYGPVLYATYLPFEQLLPWSGAWDDLPAAHGAAIVFDLLTLGGVFLLGRRVGGPPLGVVLAYAWVAYPFTLFALNTNSNDALVTLLVVAALLVASSAPARGAVTALASLVKFAPAALAPVLATHGLAGRPWREQLVRLLGFGVAFAVVLVGSLWLTVDDARTFWDRTLGFQADRDAPFSIWGLWDLQGPQRVVQAGAVILAFALAVVPRRQDLAGLAALCAAVLIGLQLGAGYWFYLYLVWFFPLVMLAVLAPRSPWPPSTPLPSPSVPRRTSPSTTSSSIAR